MKRVTNRRRRLAVLLAGTWGLAGGIAIAQPLRLSLEEAVSEMRAQSPDTIAAALKVRAAHGDLIAAHAVPNPTLSVEVDNLPLGHTNPAGLGTGQTVGVQGGLSEELVLWGKRPARIAQATNDVASAEASRADFDRTAVFEVRRRFVDVLFATERQRLAQENLDRYRETVRVSEARARAGDIAPTEAEKIALEQRSFERELADAELDRRQAIADLMPLLGREDADVDAVGSLTLPPQPGDADGLIATALDRRPDLHAAQSAVASAEAAVRLAHAEAWPNPTVGVGYTHSQFTISGDLPNSVGANLSVPLPVAYRNQGAIERATAEELSSREAVRKLRLTIPQEVRTAVASYASAHARVERFQQGFLKQAEAARRAAEVAYRNGAVSPLELLEAERTYIQTQRDYLDALHDGDVAAWDVVRTAATEVQP